MPENIRMQNEIMKLSTWGMIMTTPITIVLETVNDGKWCTIEEIQQMKLGNSQLAQIINSLKNTA